MDQPTKILGYVYLVTNLVTGKNYVGFTTKRIQDRWVEHLSEARTRRRFLLHKAIRKYGAASFTIGCLETVHGTHDELVAAEVRWIAFHRSVAPYGYNLTCGGDGVDFTVPGVRERHIKAQRQKVADPRWRVANREQLQQQHADPSWQAANASGILKAQAANRARAIARDAHLPPKERERRARRREKDRLRKNQMYAQRKAA